VIFDIRERLMDMARAPGMCAVTREGFLCQAMTILALLGIDSRPLERVGVPSNVPSSVIPLDHLLTRIEIPLDPWASELIKEALAMLPEGNAHYSIKRIDIPLV
jgi:hypothetical protein